MTDERLNFDDVADQLKAHLDEMLMGMVDEPVRQALSQIPEIMKREDWTQEAKLEAIKKLQLALVAPFLNAAVNVAQGSQMDLALFLFYGGKAWEEIRSAQMAHIAQEMLTPKHGATGEAPTG